jgi:toxin-antitoxin system PIN domain toxin
VTAALDVNILLYAADRSSEHHERARRLLEHLAAGPAILHLFWPVLIGYVRIATHPAVFERPLKLEEALAGIDDLLDRPHVRVSGEEDRFWPNFRRVAAEVEARGNLVSDAHLVALMGQQGVSTIWSHDRDFRKFAGITPKDPFEDRYGSGFS